MIGITEKPHRGLRQPALLARTALIGIWVLLSLPLHADPSPSAIKQLIAQLAEPDWILQAEALTLLGRWQAQEATPALAKIATDSDSAWLRGRALIALAQIDDSAWLQEAIARSTDDDPQLRRAAVEALALMSGDAADSAIAERLEDADLTTRYQALVAYASRRGEASWPLVQARTKSPETAVLKLAARSLAHVATPDAVTALRELYRQTDLGDRNAIIHGIHAVQDPRLVPVLLEIISHHQARNVAINTDAGRQTLNIWMREDGVVYDKIVIARDRYLVPTGLGPDAGPKPADGDAYQEVDGLVVMEAEAFTGAAKGELDAARHDWQETLERSPFSGASALVAEPNSGRNLNDTLHGPRRDYAIDFASAGTARVWVRIWGPGEGNDSLHVGLDGVPVSVGGYGVSNATDQWRWVNQVQGRDGSRLCFQALDAYDAATIGGHLRAAFSGDDPRMFAAATWTASRLLASPEIGAALADALERGVEPESRIAGLDALTNPGLAPHRFAALYTGLLADTHPRVRALATRCLALCPRADLFAHYRPLIRDKHPEVCLEALLGLARVPQLRAPREGIRNYLGNLITSADPHILEQALKVAGLYGTDKEFEAFAESLGPVLSGLDNERRMLAAQALGRLGSAKAARQVASMQGYISDWRVIGTFKNDTENTGFSTVYPPEKEQDFTKTYQAEYEWTLDNEGRRKEDRTALLREVGWYPAWGGAAGRLRMTHVLPPPAQFAVGYAVADIIRPAAGSFVAHIEADDGLRLWLNGEEILSMQTEESDKRLYQPVTRELEIDLPAGRSRLLAKSANLVGPWGFSIRLLAEDGRPAVFAIVPVEIEEAP